MSATVALDQITPIRTPKPKGLGSYDPNKDTKLHYGRILDLFDRLHEADALPIGPRGVGYRLKELWPGEYVKERKRGEPGYQFKQIGDLLTRMQQAQVIPWQLVSDAVSVTYEERAWSTPADFIGDAHTYYKRDRTEGQPVVVEVYSEARESAGLIRRICQERGVTAYSGGGSCGPGLARKVALRALARAVEFGQSTMILGVGDFDLAGIRNVMRPHLEHVSAFLYATHHLNTQVLAREVDGEIVRIQETGASVVFQHLALTPEMALDIVETDEDAERIISYIDSGTDIWNRDLTHLDGVQKVELEALDPVVLRNVVVDALDAILDTDILDRIDVEEEAEAEQIEALFATLVEDD